MGYVLKAVLSSAQHPEYGQIIPPFLQLLFLLELVLLRAVLAMERKSRLP